MMNSKDIAIGASTPRFLSGEGEMRARIREFDWSATELGHPSGWPGALKTALAIILDCAAPVNIVVGPNFIQIYNDAYISMLGEFKHPSALGSPVSASWPEIWEAVGPLLKQVHDSGQALRVENALLPMRRTACLEECYFSFTYNPLIDETGRCLGIIALPWETTVESISARRADTLRMLTQGMSEAADMRALREAFESTVRASPQDLPFGLWYETREQGRRWELVAAAGILRGTPLSPELIESLCDGFYRDLETGDCVSMRSRSFDPSLLRWDGTRPPLVGPDTLEIKPLCYTGNPQTDGYLILAVNPLRPYDDAQRDFLLTIRLHVENAVRRVARHELERREQTHHFQTLMEALPCLVWMSDQAKSCTFVNQAWTDFTGIPIEKVRRNCWKEVLHPEDVRELVRFRQAFEARESLTLEYRLRHVSGDYRWVLDKATPRYGIRGEFLGYVGTCIDITERKLAEQHLISARVEQGMLYERLQTVREEERYALAREVHDQLGQILSAAKIDLKLIEQHATGTALPVSSRTISAELESAVQSIERAIQVVRRLSTELRPPELEGQGLATAIEWHARDFERRTRIACSLSITHGEFALDDALDDMRNDKLTQALFGIFQEAMTNILRHANASRVWIRLARRGNLVVLRVRDDGIGIDRQRLRQPRSIGIKGMRERAELAGGRLSLRAQQPSGTLVTASIPLHGDGAA